MKNGMAKKKTTAMEKAAHEYHLEQARKLLEAAGYVNLPGTDQYVKLADLTRAELMRVKRRGSR